MALSATGSHLLRTCVIYVFKDKGDVTCFHLVSFNDILSFVIKDCLKKISLIFHLNILFI